VIAVVADRRPADAALDAYAAQAAHQLGEAVALLRGYTVVLEQHGDPALADVVRGLSVGTDRTQRFVDDLLDLAAVARAEVARARVELSAALAAARELLAGDLAAAGVRVHAEALVEVRADRDLVTRLLYHVLRDALAAGAEAIEVRARALEDTVEIEVCDDGEAPAGDPFAPFARARGTGPLVGAGVGLVVCARIVERLGGAIAQRHAGGTTTLTVTLPAGDARA
jgi:signal transduction histidine kinase